MKKFTGNVLVVSHAHLKWY